MGIKNISLIIVAIVILLAVISLTWPDKDTVAPTNSGQAILVEAIDADKLINDPQTFLLDVHTPPQTHIPGTDAVIPYDQLDAFQDQLPTDKDTPILVYCRSGSMSAQASERLINLGYSRVYDLAGGTDAYKEVGVEVALAPAVVNLGTVKYGDVAQTEFTLTNFTPADLNITRLATSCGCTKAEMADKALGPYEVSTVKVSFDPAVHQDDTDLGDVTRTIFIDTDNPNFPTVEASFTATVVK